MDKKTIFTKTAKGLREASGKTSLLSRDMRNLLKDIDGKATIRDLLKKLGDVTDADLKEALTVLVSEDFIRELVQETPEVVVRPSRTAPVPPPPPADGGEDLDFTAIAPPVSRPDEAAAERARAEEAMRQAQAAHARQEAEARTKAEAEARAKAEAEARAKKEAEEERTRKEAEAKARREAEENTKREAEAKAKAAADARAKQEAEARTKAEAEARTKAEAEARAKKEAEERARKEAEAKARREAEARAKQDAEAKAKAEADARALTEAHARKLAEKRAQREVEERAKAEAEKQATEEQARREAAEKAKREAEEKARHETEERAKREAEEAARREAEAKARREAEERARQEAEEKVRREVEEKARREAEEAARREAEAKARREAEEAARREAEAKARREAEERARQEAEEKARQEAEEKARRAVEERARREAEEAARHDAEERARQDAEARTKAEAEAQAQRQAEELARREAEERVERAAEERARQEAEEQARHAADERARRDEDEARARREAAETQLAAKAAKTGGGRPQGWGRLIAAALVALPVLGLALLHVMSFDGRIPQLEKAASALVQQPVKIASLHVSLFPPHWSLGGVVVGDSGQIKAPRIRLAAGLGSVFGGDIAFESIEVDSVVFNEEGLGWLLFTKPQGQGAAAGRVSVRNARLDSPTISLPAFAVKAETGGDGLWRKMTLESADKTLSVDLTSQGEGVQFEASTNSFAVPFGSSLVLPDFSATGTASRGGITLTEFKSRLHGGTLAGSARLKWGRQWSLDGELNARQIDTALLLPGLLEGDKLEGKASYALRADDGAKLFGAPRLDGTFVIKKGLLLGIDLGRMLQSGDTGGKTEFSELAGSFVHERGLTQLHPLRLSAGGLSASGSAEADGNGNVRGRLAVELRTPAELRRASLAVSGTTKSVAWSRR